MPLYHFSEDPGIRKFIPRPSRLGGEPLIWAIDEWHAPLYYTPRDCPRVCFWPDHHTTPGDRERYFGYVPARMVVAVEAAWLERLRNTVLYRYTMPEESFEDLNDNGMFVSRGALEPVAVECLQDLPERLLEAGVELRICPSLQLLRHAIRYSTLDFSMIRMANAAGEELPAPPPSVRLQGQGDSKPGMAWLDVL